MRCLRLFALILGVAACLAAQIPTPESVIGFKPGTDGRLADYRAITAYFRALDRASDRVSLVDAGPTTEGRRLMLAVISAQKNLARIEEIRKDNLALAHPQNLSAEDAARILARAKTIVLVNESIHSNELGPAQAGMQLAYNLATATDSPLARALDSVVVLLNPCHNPDGYEAVVRWWNDLAHDRKRRGEPLPVLYHKYVGHDNNRDWFMFTQVESRSTVEHMHLRWRPQIIVDQHQMGSTGARMFCPPYMDPYEPHVPPQLVQGLEEIGAFLRAQMTKRGLPGVWSRRQFDAWSPARAYMHYHGGVRVLTEVASADGADPLLNALAPRGDAGTAGKDHELPWKGGRWGLDDIVRYCHNAAEAVVLHAAEEREQWLTRFLAVHRDACAAKSGPAGYAIPVDGPRRAALTKLLDVLRLGAVEVIQTQEPLRVNDRTLPAGTLLVLNGQPCFPFAAALFERTPYPEIRLPNGALRPPYDATAHNLPLLMDLEVLRLEERPLHLGQLAAAPLGQLAQRIPLPAPQRSAGPQVLLDPRDEGALVAALNLLARGVPVSRVTEPTAGLPSGALLVPSTVDIPQEVATFPAPAALAAQPLRGGRVGVWQSWSANMDEGWTRFFCDMQGLTYTKLHNVDLERGGLRDRVDVLVLADVSADVLQRAVAQGDTPMTHGGFGVAGVAALDEFVRGGGTLLAWGGSARWAAEKLRLPVEFVKLPRQTRNFGAEGENPPSTTRFNIPGSLLWSESDGTQPLTFGLPPRLPLFFDNNGAMTLTEAKDVNVEGRLRYATLDLVAAGWAEGGELLLGKDAALMLRHGEGRVALLAFSPIFRTQTWSTFRLVLNAVLATPALN